MVGELAAVDEHGLVCAQERGEVLRHRPLAHGRRSVDPDQRLRPDAAETIVHLDRAPPSRWMCVCVFQSGRGVGRWPQCLELLFLGPQPAALVLLFGDGF